MSKSVFFLERSYTARIDEMERIEFNFQQDEEFSFYERLQDLASHYTPIDFFVAEVSRGCFVASLSAFAIEQRSNIDFSKFDVSVVVGVSHFKKLSNFLVSFKSNLDLISIKKNLNLGFIPSEKFAEFQ